MYLARNQLTQQPIMIIITKQNAGTLYLESSHKDVTRNAFFIICQLPKKKINIVVNCCFLARSLEQKKYSVNFEKQPTFSLLLII